MWVFCEGKDWSLLGRLQKVGEASETQELWPQPSGPCDPNHHIFSPLDYFHLYAFVAVYSIFLEEK